MDKGLVPKKQELVNATGTLLVQIVQFVPQTTLAMIVKHVWRSIVILSYDTYINH